MVSGLLLFCVANGNTQQFPSDNEVWLDSIRGVKLWHSIMKKQGFEESEDPLLEVSKYMLGTYMSKLIGHDQFELG